MTKLQRNLAIIFTVGFILLTIGMIVLPSGFAAKLESPLFLVVGCWITNITTIVNYSYGSSAGSKSKTDALLIAFKEDTKVD